MRVCCRVGIAAILLALPAFGQQPFFDRTHDSRVFGEARHYRILLPPDHQPGGKRYPVIYYFHGHSERYAVEKSTTGPSLSSKWRSGSRNAPQAFQLITNDRRSRMAFGITVDLSSFPS